MEGLKIEDQLKDLEPLIGRTFVDRFNCVTSDILNNSNYSTPYVGDISDIEAAKIGLSSDWHHIFYNNHSNTNGFGLEIAFPLNNPTITPKYRNAINKESPPQGGKPKRRAFINHKDIITDKAGFENARSIKRTKNIYRVRRAAQGGRNCRRTP